MADDPKNLNAQMTDRAEELKGKSLEKYEDLIDRLYEQRDNLRRELDREYNDAREFVRTNPEEGMLIGLVGGFVVGIVFSQMLKK